MIRCIGDSHVSVFSGKNGMQPTFPNEFDVEANPRIHRCNLIPNITQHRIGPFTAYNFCNKNEKVQSTLDAVVNKSVDTVMFSAGEIDCREHIVNQSRLQSRTIESIVNECVERYMAYTVGVKSRSYNVGCIGPHLAFDSPDNPDILKATKLFNEYVKLICDQNNMPFISVFEYTLNNRTMDNYLPHDTVHMSIAVVPDYIRQLKELGLINE